MRLSFGYLSVCYQSSHISSVQYLSQYGPVALKSAKIVQRNLNTFHKIPTLVRLLHYIEYNLMKPTTFYLVVHNGTVFSSIFYRTKNRVLRILRNYAFKKQSFWCLTLEMQHCLFSILKFSSPPHKKRILQWYCFFLCYFWCY